MLGPLAEDRVGARREGRQVALPDRTGRRVDDEQRPVGGQVCEAGANCPREYVEVADHRVVPPTSC